MGWTISNGAVAWLVAGAEHSPPTRVAEEGVEHADVSAIERLALDVDGPLLDHLAIAKQPP